MEETHRRNEASMRRKQANLSPNSPTPGTDTPPSPAASGAMDDLLAKLRAAKPEARDQRDRRRRARLKDRYQTRVASGQKMQDMASLVRSPDNIEASLLSPTSEVSSEAIDEVTDDHVAPENLNDEDVADRAASLLEGLRGETGAEEGEDGEKIPLPREESIRIRRRRENAQDERAARRRRRQQATSATDTTLGHPRIAEEAENENNSEQLDDFEKRESSSSGDKAGDGEEREGVKPTTPVTIVHPPSPSGESKTRLATPPGNE